MLFKFVINNPALFDVIGSNRAMLMLMKTRIEIPVFLNVYRIIMTLVFLGFIIYMSYALIVKQEFQNIYFDKIKNWSKMLITFIVGMFIIFAPVAFIKVPEILTYIFSASSFLTVILFVFYRPSFLNKSALKISFGSSFNRDADYAISELEFINEFYTKLYFLQNDASLENLAKVLNISSNDLYKFIYYKYSMTFNDLVNKNRVDYFIDIIHNPKYLNFTIDALAKEAGFSSRQHLYKPFKKFHGGNPSDIMDAVSF
ncbi:MAG: helix-turn-helix domain-containing protein [Sediminibacterium sp.]